METFRFNLLPSSLLTLKFILTDGICLLLFRIGILVFNLQKLLKFGELPIEEVLL